MLYFGLVIKRILVLKIYKLNVLYAITLASTSNYLLMLIYLNKLNDNKIRKVKNLIAYY